MPINPQESVTTWPILLHSEAGGPVLSTAEFAHNSDFGLAAVVRFEAKVTLPPFGRDGVCHHGCSSLLDG